MIGLAFSLIFPLFLGFVLGSSFDKAHSSKFPIGTIIGGVIGMASGIYNLYKSYK